MSIDLYMQKPVEVEAAQFLGWQTLHFEVFMAWLSKNKPFYVPSGHEHYMRRENEKDHSRGDTLAGAPPYLVLEINGKPTRVDYRSWIVRLISGHIIVLTEEEFKKQYDRSPNNGV